MITNLQNIEISSRKQLNQAIEKMAQGKTDAYSLSLPLMAAAVLGEQKIYQNLLNNIKIALGKMPDDAQKAWLLGRVLFAAKSINDDNTLTEMQPQLIKLIKSNATGMPNSLGYAMYAWAYGYLAAVDWRYISGLMPTASSLATAYQENRSAEQLSNTMWALVLDLQAAANNQDQSLYKEVLLAMKELTNKNTIAEALQAALTRNDTSSDYPAWAISIVQLAAVKMQDPLVEELKQPLHQAIEAATKWGSDNRQSANKWKATAETTLANINAVLSEHLEHCVRAQVCP